MQKPAKSQIESSAEHPDTPEALRFDVLDAESLDRAIELAVHYRGDVTITKRDGVAIVGYVYDRRSARPGREAAIRIIPADGPRITLLESEIQSIELTGKNTASGRSFETWMKKYVERKLAGERAAIDETDEESQSG